MTCFSFCQIVGDLQPFDTPNVFTNSNDINSYESLTNPFDLDNFWKALEKAESGVNTDVLGKLYLNPDQKGYGGILVNRDYEIP